MCRSGLKVTVLFHAAALCVALLAAAAGVGRYVYKTHHDPAPDGAGAEAGLEDEAEVGRETARSKLVPFVATSFSRARREYGLALSWSF